MASFTLSSSFRRTLQLASPHQQLHRPQSLTVTATRAFSSIRSSRRLNNPSIPLQLSHNHFRLTSSHHHAKSFHSTASTMGVHNVANKAEFDAALKEHKVVVLDAFATWCGPCKMIAPQVVKFSEQYTNAYFIKLDVDEVPDVAQELAIRAMPTFLIFKDGEKFHSVVGANPRALVDGIEKALA